MKLKGIDENKLSKNSLWATVCDIDNNENKGNNLIFDSEEFKRLFMKNENNIAVNKSKTNTNPEKDVNNILKRSLICLIDARKAQNM